MNKPKIIVCLFIFNLLSFQSIYCMDHSQAGLSQEELQRRAHMRAQRAGKAIRARALSGNPLSASYDVLPDHRKVALPVSLKSLHAQSHGSLPKAGSPPIMISSHTRAGKLRRESKQLVRTAGLRNSMDDSVGASSGRGKKLLEVVKDNSGRAMDDKSGSSEIQHRPLVIDLDSTTPEGTPPRVLALRRKEKTADGYMDSLLTTASAAGLSRELRAFYGAQLTDQEIVRVENELLIAVITQLCTQGHKQNEAAAKLRVIIQVNATRDQSPFKRRQPSVLKLLFTCSDPHISILTSIFTRQFDASDALVLLALLEKRKSD